MRNVTRVCVYDSVCVCVRLFIEDVTWLARGFYVKDALVPSNRLPRGVSRRQQRPLTQCLSDSCVGAGVVVGSDVDT